MKKTKQRKSLKDTLEEHSNIIKITSLKQKPDDKYNPRLSSFMSVNFKVQTLIDLLDDIYELEQSGDEYSLIKKK